MNLGRKRTKHIDKEKKKIIYLTPCSFRADKLVAAVPETVKSVAVLDRTKEPGSQGEQAA